MNTHHLVLYHNLRSAFAGYTVPLHGFLRNVDSK